MSDARISTALPNHPKTKKLVRRLGPAAGWSLLCLILWARANRADGDLSGMSAEDIELAADWGGVNDAFVRELASVGFLDGEEGDYQLHDWADHQPWAAGSDLRSLKAKWNAVKRHHGEREADRQVPDYAQIRAANAESDASSKRSDASSNAPSNDAAMRAASSSNAPSPSPSPSPSPRTKASPTDVGESAASGDADLLGDQRMVVRKPERTPCPQQAIVDLYHETLPALRAVRTWTGERPKLLGRRWAEDPKRQTLDWWRRFFGYVARSDYLMGRTTGRDGRPFDCDLEWLIRPKNFPKVIEGKYHDEVAA